MYSLSDISNEPIAHAGLYVRVIQDMEPDSMNPRTQYDVPSTWHSVGYEGESRISDAYMDVAEWIREKRFEGCSVVPVRYEDYGSSGARLYETDADNANGAFVCDRETVRKEWGSGVGRSDAKATAGARRYMRGEIEEMDQYLQGNVFGIGVFESEDSEDAIESVWGFIGKPDSEWILEEAKSLAEGVAAERKESAARELAESTWAAQNEIATV